ncbi:hypothetical protein [Halomonas colorata]|uniref:hypothetical protein n=1 Tax=Halomonas colorata TaxID=2742615 RepID=UPI00186637DA|nr:hypothetical protein [Halomonas colorata]
MDKIDIFNTNAIEIDCISNLDDLVYIDYMSRFNYKTKCFKYYGLIRKSREESEKLYVFLHGAKDRDKNREPYFDRWSWVDVFDGYMLSFSDPTLQLDTKLGLAWYGGDYSEHPLEIIISIVDRFAEVFNIRKENIIFWGSSGGGYASIYASLKLSGSKAVAFNPQCNALNYHERHVKRYLNIGFNVKDVEALNENILQRLTISDTLIKESKSKIAIFQNTKDSFHYKNHFLELQARIRNIESTAFKFFTYSDDRGHGPESKQLAKDVNEKLSHVFEGSYKVVYAPQPTSSIEISNSDISKFLSSDKKSSSEFYLEIFRILSEDKKGGVSKAKVDELYSKAINEYPGGWSLKYLYAKHKNNVGEISISLKVLLEIYEKFVLKNEKIPEKVVKELKVVSEKISYKQFSFYLNSDSSNATLDATDFLFKFGFLLIDKRLSFSDSTVENWNIEEVDNSFLYTHPLLKVVSFLRENTKIIVLGDIYNSFNDQSVEDCLFNIVDNNDWEALDYLSGRFSILLFSDKMNLILSDPFGSRTVFYSLDAKVIGSHATLVAQVIGEPLDKKAKAFIKSPEYKRRGTVYLPGDSTMYQSIKGLSPNNFLDLNSFQTTRFWPREKSKTESLEDFLGKVDSYFKRTSLFLKHKEYVPILGLTAGVDSRAIIAGLKFYDQKPKLITWTRLPESEKPTVDKMQVYLNLPHKYIDNKRFPSERKAVLSMISAKFNSGLYRGVSALSGQMCEQANIEKGLFIRGLGGEICRGFYNRNNYEFNVDEIVTSLVKLYLTKKLNVDKLSPDFEDFVFSSISGFIDRANYDTDFYGYDVLDLYYWEQRMGMWAANLLNEMDAAIQDFVGLNSRVVYQSAMTLDKELRIGSRLMLDITSMYDNGFAEINYQS